jgi:hypothetical protein
MASRINYAIVMDLGDSAINNSTYGVDRGIVRVITGQPDYKSIDIGAVTGGPFVAGEQISGGTSGALGTVLLNAANGDPVILYKVQSGTFASGS